MNKEQTGRLIKEARISKNYTQNELGELVCVSNKAVSRWENGEAFPDISVIEKLAKVLDLSVEDIISGEPAGLHNTQDKRKRSDKGIIGHIVSVFVFAIILLMLAFVSKGFARGAIPLGTYVLVLTLLLAAITVSAVKRKRFEDFSRDRKSKIMFIVSLVLSMASILNCIISSLLIVRGHIPFGMALNLVGPYLNLPLIIIFVVNVFFLSFDFFLVEFKEKRWSVLDFLYVFFAFTAIAFTDSLHGAISANDMTLHALSGTGIFLVEAGVSCAVCRLLAKLQ